MHIYARWLWFLFSNAGTSPRRRFIMTNNQYLHLRAIYILRVNIQLGRFVHMATTPFCCVDRNRSAFKRAGAILRNYEQNRAAEEQPEEFAEERAVH